MDMNISTLVCWGLFAGLYASTATEVAVVNLNNTEADKPMYCVTWDGIRVSDPLYVEFWASANGGIWEPVQAGLNPAETSWKLDENGYFNAGIGVIPGIEPDSLVVFKVLLWTRADSARDAYYVTQCLWTQATGTWITDSQPASTPDSVMLQIPYNVTIVLEPEPEPSTMALGFLGAALLFAWHSGRFGPACRSSRKWIAGASESRFK